MVTVLLILLGLSMLATLGVLFAGMFGVIRGANNPSRSNALMRWRVIFQGITIVLFIVLLLAMKAGT